MQGIIRIADKTTYRGKVKSGSDTLIFGGIGVARKGNKVSCPGRGGRETTVVEGNADFLGNDIPVAFHDHKCGCKLITSLPQAMVG